MSDRKKWVERIKTALIILLSCSAILLLSLSGLISSNMLDSLRPGSGETTENIALAHTGSAPLVISVNLGEGLRYGVKYDAHSLQTLYSGFSVVLAEALGSAGEPVPVPQEQWRAALSEKSVYMDFLYPQPLDSLSNGLGVRMLSSAAQSWTARICLAPEGEQLRLYFCSGGDYYACDTALRAEALNISEEMVTNGASFAWESDRNSVDPEFLILTDMPDIPELNITNTVNTAMENDGLLTRAGLNAVIASRYPESDGSSVYVEGERTLRVSANGTVAYHYYIPDDMAAQNSDEADAVEAAWIFAERTVGAHCGGAQLHLADAFFDEGERTWRVEFAYVVNGIAVELGGDNPAARVYVQGGTVYAADLTFRGFENGEGTLSPLPDKQAFAAMQAANCLAQLTYFEGTDGCTVQWKKMGEVD